MNWLEQNTFEYLLDFCFIRFMLQISGTGFSMNYMTILEIELALGTHKSYSLVYFENNNPVQN